jgi:hypothetical protein
MISNDVIHVQAEEGEEDSKVKGIDILEANDFLSMVHNAW